MLTALKIKLSDYRIGCGFVSSEEFAEVIGVNYETARYYVKIFLQWQLGDRSPKLTHTHHAVIAYEDNKKELLKWAIEKEASVSALR